MEGIEFEKEAYRPMVAPISKAPQKPLLIRLVFKFSGGLIKTDAQAMKALFVVALILFILSIYNFTSGKKSAGPKINPIMIQKINPR